MGVKDVIVDDRFSTREVPVRRAEHCLEQPSRHQGQRLMRRWPRIANWLAASLVSG
jgi:hypothetical protein